MSEDVRCCYCWLSGCAWRGGICSCDKSKCHFIRRVMSFVESRDPCSMDDWMDGGERLWPLPLAIGIGQRPLIRIFILQVSGFGSRRPAECNRHTDACASVGVAPKRPEAPQFGISITHPNLTCIG